MVNRWLSIFTVTVLSAMISACHPHHTAAGNTATDSILRSPGLSAYTDAILQHPDSARLYYARSNMLFGMKQYALAKEDLQTTIRLRPETGSYFFALGEVYLAQDSITAALQNLREAARLDPSDLSIQLAYANALYQAKEYQTALQYLQDMQQHYPNAAEIYGLQSQLYSDLKDTARAIQALRKGVQLAPGNYDAVMAMGDLLSAANDIQCLQWYDKARMLDTANGEPLYSKALFYRKSGRPADAIRSLEQSITADGNYVASYITLGQIYVQQKQLSEAVKIFNLAEKMAPSDPEIYLQRGYCYQAAGDTTAAAADFRRALALDKDSFAAKKALEKRQP